MAACKMRNVFFLLLLCARVFSQEYVMLSNSPLAGEDLQLLVDGAGNGTAKIISPGGQEFLLALKNGQGRMKVETSGIWLVEFGGQRKAVTVSEQEFAGGQGAAEADWAQIAAFSFVLLSILAAVAFSAWKNFYRKDEGKPDVEKAGAKQGKDGGLEARTKLRKALSASGNPIGFTDTIKSAPKTQKRKLERAAQI